MQSVKNRRLPSAAITLTNSMFFMTVGQGFRLSFWLSEGHETAQIICFLVMPMCHVDNTGFFSRIISTSL
jgi:hypothetical protein